MTEDKTNISSLHNLLDFDAGRFISAELELERILPAWIEDAGTVQLKTVLQKYLEFVHQHL